MAHMSHYITFQNRKPFSFEKKILKQRLFSNNALYEWMHAGFKILKTGMLHICFCISFHLIFSPYWSEICSSWFFPISSRIFSIHVCSYCPLKYLNWCFTCISMMETCVAYNQQVRVICIWSSRKDDLFHIVITHHGFTNGGMVSNMIITIAPKFHLYVPFRSTDLD
jgi:hypothetical protein